MPKAFRLGDPPASGAFQVTPNLDRVALRACFSGKLATVIEYTDDAVLEVEDLGPNTLSIGGQATGLPDPTQHLTRITLSAGTAVDTFTLEESATLATLFDGSMVYDASGNPTWPQYPAPPKSGYLDVLAAHGF